MLSYLEGGCVVVMLCDARDSALSHGLCLAYAGTSVAVGQHEARPGELRQLRLALNRGLWLRSLEACGRHRSSFVSSSIYVVAHASYDLSPLFYSYILHRPLARYDLYAALLFLHLT